MKKIFSCFLAFLILLSGCATQPANKITVPQDTVSLMPAAWVISYSPGMPTHPSGRAISPLSAAAAGWSFDFPDKDDVHYVMVPYYAAKPHKTLTITYRVAVLSGAPKFVSVDPCVPNEAASFSPILERQGDMMVASQEFYRWWGYPPITLVADGQVHTASYPLTADRWSSVFGKFGTQAPAEFATSLKSLMGVGITFGGCFAGHGDFNTGGKARFTLLNYQIQ